MSRFFRKQFILLASLYEHTHFSSLLVLEASIEIKMGQKLKGSWTRSTTLWFISH
jgi:hypothetical protein